MVNELVVGLIGVLEHILLVGIKFGLDALWAAMLTDKPGQCLQNWHLVGTLSGAQ